jgi:hypothetical protein
METQASPYPSSEKPPIPEKPKEKKKPGRKKKVIPTIQFEKKEVILLFD